MKSFLICLGVSYVVSSIATAKAKGARIRDIPAAQIAFYKEMFR